MVMCGSCSGSGTNTCYSCGGRKFHQRPSSGGDMEIVTCAACLGRGRVKCQFCAGSGKVGPDVRIGAPGPGTSRAHEDPLAGRWHAAQGGSYEFVKQGSRYALTEYGPFGKTGSGTATVAANVVTLDFTNAMLGRVSLKLRLSGNSLQGTVNVMGMSMPFVLTRG